MNPLEQYPKVRNTLYIVQWVVNLVLGALGVALVALGESPLWYVITTAVFNFVWSYSGLTAQANTVTAPADDEDAEAPVEDWE